MTQGAEQKGNPPRRPMWMRLAGLRSSSHLMLLASCVLLALCFASGCGRGEEEKSAERAGVTAASTAPVVFPVAQKSPRPGGKLPADASCVTAQCHAELTQAAQVHTPVAKRTCDSCHEADVGGHKYPLKLEGDALCASCHAVAGTQSHQHKALEKGCLSCHKSHTSETNFLLNQPSVGQLCGTCHILPVQRFAHETFAKGECTTCHQPHQSDTTALMRGGSGRDACLTCHEKTRTAMASAAYVHKPAAGECRACHEGHSAKYPHLLTTEIAPNCLSCHPEIKKHVDEATVKHSAMLADNQCGNCHDAHAAADKNLLRERMDKVCLSCHDKAIKMADGREIANMKPVLTESKFLHGPVKTGSCSGCHDPHGSEFPALLDYAFPSAFYTSFAVEKYELCFRCHDKKMVLEEQTDELTGFRDGRRNLHFMHVNRAEKGRSCRTCHEMHGSNLPGHMASEVPFEGSKWSMPIEFEQLPNGGSCSPGCHVPRRYDRGSATSAPTTQSASGPATSAPTTQGAK